MDTPETVFALALGCGVLSQIAAAYLRVPSIVVLFSVGLLLGPEALGWIDPEALGDGLFAVVSLSVAVILFEGGLNLSVAHLRREGGVIRSLVTTGALITWFGAAGAVHWILGWSWALSLLFGAIVIVTGPTVIGPLLRTLRVRPAIATVLEAEGVLIDPIGAIVAALTLEFVLAPSADSLTASALGLLPRLAFGAAAGAAAGWLIALVLRRRRLEAEGLDSLFVLGAVLVLYTLCDATLSESGILAVVAAGVALANLSVRLPPGLREFKGTLTEGLIGLLFVLLAADVGVSEMAALGLGGLASVAVLIAVIRPLGVAASAWGSGLSFPERAFVAWLAPRGIVAAAVASFAAASLEAHGQPGGAELRALVFLTIAITVVVLGGLGPLVARMLDVRAPERDAILILGADEVGRALAEELRAGGRNVVFLDSNPDHCRIAQERGWTVVFGNALEERTLARARPERALAVVGVTANETVNSLFVREARELFDVPQAYAALESGHGGVPRRLLERERIFALFDGEKDIERWTVRFRHRLVEVERFRWSAPLGDPELAAASPAQPSVDDLYVILTIERGGLIELMHDQIAPREGDAAAVAVHGERREDALEALAALGWHPDEPAVEPVAAESGAQVG
jgi:NhaP-type Na+/H+ or K+/H+ antiporter